MTIPPGRAAGPIPTRINVGYFLNWPVPGQFSQLKKTFDYALGLELNWIAYADGEAMNAALANGELQLAFAQGHVPFIIAVSGGTELTMVGVAVDYTDNDNCILHADAAITRSTASLLEGRKIAVQKGSLTHYRLLETMRHLGVDAGKLQVMPVPDGAAAAAALQRGEVVMACASGTALRAMNALGQPLMSAAELAAIGLKLFDVITVPTAFMQQHPRLVQAFMDIVEASNQQWHKNAEPMRAVIARAADMDLDSANQAIDRFNFPSAAEQKTAAWLALEIPLYTKKIADFFVAEGQLEQALDSYERFVTTRFLR